MNAMEVSLNAEYAVEIAQNDVTLTVTSYSPIISSDATDDKGPEGYSRIPDARRDGRQYPFRFHHVFSEDATQAEVYDLVAQPLIEDVLTGINGAIIAYGQTGSGKTHTMMGPSGDDPRMSFESLDAYTKGIIPRMMDEMFERMELSAGHFRYEIHASYLEIYKEQLRDLLDPETDGDPWSRTNGRKLEIHQTTENTIWVRGATQTEVRTKFDVFSILREGNRNRHTAATSMNPVSSRSHAVFVLTVHKVDRETEEHSMAQLYLVDLAGSERVSKSRTHGVRLQEGQKINFSLHTLGRVIDALTKSSKNKKSRARSPSRSPSQASRGHIPYRDSKLTRLLSTCFGGNARTALVVNIAPSDFNSLESLSTLMFGARSSLIRNAPTANRFHTVEELTRELKSVRSTLSAVQSENNHLRNLLSTLTLTHALDPNALAQASLLSSSPSSSSSSAAAASSSTLGSPSRRALPPPTYQASADSSSPPTVRVRGSRELYFSDADRVKRQEALAFLCPITQSVMVEPVVAADGVTYERWAIEKWMAQHGAASPVTPLDLAHSHLVPNTALARLIRLRYPFSTPDAIDLINDTCPPEILDEIFDFMDVPSLLSCTLVCRRWYHLASTHPRWRKWLQTRYRVTRKSPGVFLRPNGTQHPESSAKAIFLPLYFADEAASESGSRSGARHTAGLKLTRR